MNMGIHYIIDHPSGDRCIGFKCGCTMHTGSYNHLNLLPACPERHEETFLRQLDPIKRYDRYFPRPQG